MIYRQFWIINSEGNRYDLSDIELDVSLDDPEGLGFTKTIETETIGNQRRITEEHVDFQQITGDITFYRGDVANKYKGYYDFIQFIKMKPLKLYYLPPNSEEPYYCDVSITELTKSEILRDDKVLHSNITFDCLNHWRTENERTIVMSGSVEGEGREYPQAYPYGYTSGGFSGIELRNTGTEDVGMVIEIVGECQNPYITFYGTDNIIYGILALNGHFDYVKVDTTDINESIYLEYNGSPVLNPVSYQAFDVYQTHDAQATFVQLKPGTSRTSAFFDNEFDGTVSISWRPAYATI